MSKLAMFLSILIILLLIIVTYYYASSSFKNQNAPILFGSEIEYSEKRYSIRKLFKFFFPDAISFFTCCLVLATIALCAISLEQIDFLRRSETIATNAAKAAQDAAIATKNAVKLSERTANQQLRAYVSPSTGNFSNQGGLDGKPFRLSLTFKNFGQTPAHNLIIRFHGTLANNPPAEPLKLPNKDHINCGVLGPSSEYTISVNVSALNAVQIQQLKSQAAVVYIFGNYSYMDIFGEKQTGNFRLYYDFDGSIHYSSEGNSAS